jgi:signal peptidase II
VPSKQSAADAKDSALKPSARNPPVAVSERAESLPLNRYLVYFSIAISGCLLDLWTKHAVFQWRGIEGAKPPWWIIEGYFGFETAMNPGALFGIGAGFSMLFAVLSIVAAVGILAWLFYGKAARDWWLTIALACVTAGIFGNLYDRLGYGFTDDMREQYVAARADPEFIATREHAVRDWILFQWPTEAKAYKWPNFNIADMLLVCGASALVWRSFQKPPDENDS